MNTARHKDVHLVRSKHSILPGGIQMPASIPDQVPCKLMRGGQGFFFGFKNHARDVTPNTAVETDLFYGGSASLAHQAYNVFVPSVNKPLFKVPPHFFLTHVLPLLFRLKPIVQSRGRRSKAQPATLATITPPRDLRTLLHKECSHG